MPTYEYHCEACEHDFEEFQSIMEDPLKKCPACKKNKLRRLFGTGSAVIFKGSGFYQTDYRSDSYKAGAKAEKDAGSKPEGGDKEGSSKKSAGDKTDTPGAADKGSKENGVSKDKKSSKSKPRVSDD